MANTKNDVAQQATRWFLTELGRRYDESRGRKAFRPTGRQWQEVLDYFKSACAYCGKPMAEAPILKDHLIPLNKDAGGLHAWGNVVPSCRPCNNSKGSHKWREWLQAEHGRAAAKRIRSLEKFAAEHGYELNTDFTEPALRLYRKVIKSATELVQAEVQQCSKIFTSSKVRGRAASNRAG